LYEILAQINLIIHKVGRKVGQVIVSNKIVNNKVQ